MWTDQCVNAFKMQAESLLWKKKNTIQEIIRQLSIDSGIPEDLLQIWWNGDYQNMKPDWGSGPSERTKCRLCQKNEAEIKNNRVYSHRLCVSCRKKAAKAKQTDKDPSSSDGRIASCPRCNHAFYVKKEDKNNDSKT